METSKILVLIDCGHGGLDTNGKYTTAPSKMFKFPDGLIMYEGVHNRVLGANLNCELRTDCIETLFTVDPSDPTDVSLYDRVELEKKLAREGYNTIFVSLHSNAGGGKGTGFEIFTSVGQTKSDILADFIGEKIICEFPTIKFRRDMTDGDLDKESQFYVLKNTIGAAVLIENLFFDNRFDADLIRSESFQKRAAKTISTGIKNYINYATSK